MIFVIKKTLYCLALIAGVVVGLFYGLFEVFIKKVRK